MKEIDLGKAIKTSLLLNLVSISIATFFTGVFISKHNPAIDPSISKSLLSLCFFSLIYFSCSVYSFLITKKAFINKFQAIVVPAFSYIFGQILPILIYLFVIKNGYPKPLSLIDGFSVSFLIGLSHSSPSSCLILGALYGFSNENFNKSTNIILVVSSALTLSISVAVI